MPNKILTKSNDNKLLCGVCGGFADYLDCDATILRIIALMFLVASGIIPAIVAYLISAAVMPNAEIKP